VEDHLAAVALLLTEDLPDFDALGGFVARPELVELLG
jgi:hypothetical protein